MPIIQDKTEACHWINQVDTNISNASPSHCDWKTTHSVIRSYNREPNIKCINNLKRVEPRHVFYLSMQIVQVWSHNMYHVYKVLNESQTYILVFNRWCGAVQNTLLVGEPPTLVNLSLLLPRITRGRKFSSVNSMKFELYLNCFFNINARYVRFFILVIYGCV